jgi:hypothetical protein
MRVRLLLGFALAAAGSVAAVNVPTAGADPVTGDPTHAWFEGGEIDLSKSWGDATACVELGDHTECFRTEAEMLEAHPELAETTTTNDRVGSSRVSSDATIQAACSTGLRLYRVTSYGGIALSLTTRSIWHNMASYGYDNDTSSYKVGGCSSVFRAGASGAGSTYPGNTGANAWAASMLAGWDNVVSSVYIN